MFFAELVNERKRHPGDDVVSELLATVEGEKLNEEDVVSVAKLFLIAGNETTTHLIGNALLVLLENPPIREAVSSDPSLLPDLVEETLRYDAPVQFVQRRASETVELAGARIPEGAVITALLASANRDETRFPDPDRFDLSRKPQGHLAFGVGPHACLGASLARLEARIALEAVLPRLARARLVQNELAWVGPPMRGVRALPVRF